MKRRDFLLLTGAATGAWCFPLVAQEQLPAIPPQPYFANVKRALETLAKLGSPVSPSDTQQIVALAQQNDAAAVEQVEKVLDHYTLASLLIGSDGTSQISPGGAQRTLLEQGWCMFLVRIANPTGITDNINFSAGGRLTWHSGDTAMLPYDSSAIPLSPDLPWSPEAQMNDAPWIKKMWLLAQLDGTTSVNLNGIEIPTVLLSGFPLEYQVIQMFSRDAGHRTGSLIFSGYSKAGQGYSARREFDFDCLPSHVVMLGIQDVDGRGCVASLLIKDKLGRIYPSQAMRLAPDLYFQSQVYRADRETILLPDGEYTVESKRGPEYVDSVQTIKIEADHKRIDVKLHRWIDPAQWGWYSGDTHIHAAGCSHYEIPTEGVSPETMIRQVRGEALSVGEVLSWAPGWYYQKQFFTGHTESPAAKLEHPELQTANNANWQPKPTPEDHESTLRYDVEVSGFPSSHCGHLVLLRLKEQDYPGTRIIEDWPSWNLPILKWARAQDALGGYAHCGLGMAVHSKDLPNYLIPPMNGIGTQEAIIDVTHGLVDFLSGCDTQPVPELNAWYHMLNCGFRLGMAGETDFPCMSDERPGAGRSYVQLDQGPVGESGYEAWIRSLHAGRMYCGDGRSHFLDFKVNGRRSGEGNVALATPGALKIEALVAARLEPDAPGNHHTQRRGWNLEFARIGMSREVPVELVINGNAVDKTTLIADGTPRSLQLNATIARSSWIALRIFPSAHTHPIFVQVAGKPIRASKRSAQWCRDCVDKVWEVKSPFMRGSERPAAAEAFDHARKTYDQITDECDVA